MRFRNVRIPATPSEAFPHAAHYHRPLIPVTLSTGRKSARLLALIDSGADNTIFNLQVAAMLGLRLGNLGHLDLRIGTGGLVLVRHRL